MKINLNQAIKAFHPSPSLEQVYFEAIANALDAGATDINVHIKLKAFDSPETLCINIRDNGEGFTPRNFSKFSSLMEADSADHKGLGRLLYLAYFKEAHIKSYYNDKYCRSFNFDINFEGECEETEESSPHGTIISLTQFAGTQIKSYSYLKPEDLKDAILQHFLPLLIAKKKDSQQVRITLDLEVADPNPEKNFFSDQVFLGMDDLPELKTKSFQCSNIDFFTSIEIMYFVKHDVTKPRSVRTSINVDGRSIEYEILSDEAIPHGYQVFFLFSSEYFTGRTDSSRQRLQLPGEITEKTLRSTLRREIGLILEQELPSIRETNIETTNRLAEKFPHLIGLYPQGEPGLIIENVALSEAQKKFFDEQRTILECDGVDEEQYHKAVEFSARALMEYVLYRARIIEKLKRLDSKSNEDEYHKLLVPMKRILPSGSWQDDIYTNNVWMLDDKFMSYNSILSDKSMKDLLDFVQNGEVDDDSRPDIALVFSEDPDSSNPFSVVIVELKKRNIPLAKREEVHSQLRQRARRLLEYYPHKIDRLWFYGICDINDEFRRSLLEDQFRQLYSSDQVYYKSQPIIVKDENNPFAVDLFIMSYDALIKDAECRNQSFINILRARILSHLEVHDVRSSTSSECIEVSLATE